MLLVSGQKACERQPHLQAHRVISLTCRILLEITSIHSFLKKNYFSQDMEAT